VRRSRPILTVLVVADERPLLVGRERRLARAAQPEEHRHVAFRAHVATRVQAQDTPLRQPVIHQREHSLLHLPRVLRSQDDHLFVLQRHVDRRRRGHVGRIPVGGERAGIINGEVGGT
jgi:hypothetical protein